MTGGDLRPQDVVAVARDEVAVELGPGVADRLRLERAVVEGAVAEGRPVYGLTTGLGARSTHPLTADELAGFSARTVRGRAAGVGARLDREVVRAALVARVNAMAHGGSGVQPAVVELLVAMLVRDVVPDVPATGSIGASDLCLLAHVGLVVMGEGSATLDGRSGPAAEVLARAGLAPVALGPKDGLALCSANSVTAGGAALAVADAEELWVLLHGAAAASFEGFRANTGPLRPEVLAARPAPGQAASAAELRRMLAGSLLSGEGAARRLQDPISFRCAAQVHGSLRAALDFLAPALDAELNGAADNPLVLTGAGPGGALVSNGNFHTPVLALALDTLVLAVAQTAAVCVARIQRLLTARLTDLPANLAPAGLGRSGYASVVKTGQALLAELHHLAMPTSTDPRPGAEDVEDDATNAALGAARARAAIDRLRLVVAAEALVAARAVELAAPARTGVGAALVVEAVRAGVPAADDDRPPGPDIETVASTVLTPDLARRLAGS